MNDLYETKISDARWWAYDIPGNIGWITYVAVMIHLFRNPPAYMEVPLVMACLIVGILPAIAMAGGILELISERIAKLDRILPRKRLLRGFGALTWGGFGGTIISLTALFIGIRAGFAFHELSFLVILAAGAALCALFAGLIFKSFHKQSDVLMD